MDQQRLRAIKIRRGEAMAADDRCRAAIRTLGLPRWKWWYIRIFARSRVESDGHTWACWCGLYYFVR